MIGRILEWVQTQRPDVQWLKGPDSEGRYKWDTTLPNQLQIQELINSYDPNFQLTEEQQKQRQRETDYIRFKKRAMAKDGMIAEMAAGNMERVRSGVWTTSQLISLTQDEQLKQILSDIGSLSFEIAYAKIGSLTNPLITTEIKNSWKKLLSDNFYL